MKKFLTTFLYTMPINASVIYAYKILSGYPLTHMNVFVLGAITSLIGIGLSYAIPYAIKLAKEHEV